MELGEMGIMSKEELLGGVRGTSVGFGCMTSTGGLHVA